MISARTVTIREETGELPYLLSWESRARFQIRYFSTYLAAVNMLEALNDRGVAARLYAELTIEIHKPPPVEEPLPAGVSREDYERSKERERHAARRLHRG